MALIEDTLYGRVDKVKTAIARIELFDPLKNGYMDTPYFAAYSGGKDSDAIRILLELAGVRYDLVHHHTTVDAPETVRYVRSIPNMTINYPEMSMWRLIVKKGMPPTRVARYCCEALKENGGNGRFVMTGVRWAESVNRKKKRASVEVLGHRAKAKLMLNADNDESRRLFETCTMRGKRVINPIVDWEDSDVWEFLHHYGCESNPIYRQYGLPRIGCVGCPLASRWRAREFYIWPKYKENYIRAFQKLVDEKGYANTSTNWSSGEAMFQWWMLKPNHEKRIEGQESMFDDSENDLNGGPE